MEDFSHLYEVVVNGMKLIPLIVGLMEVAKTQFGVKGKTLVVSALTVLLVIGFGAGMMAEGLMPEAALPWIDVGVYALAFVLAGAGAMGLHTWSKKFRPPSIASSLAEADALFHFEGGVPERPAPVREAGTGATDG